MDKKYKRKWGDKKDGRLIRGKELDSNHWVMPLVWPNRTDNEAYIHQLIDLTNIDKYLEKKNDNQTKERYSLFMILVTAFGKVFMNRPKMNRFYRNGKLYERYDVSLGFITKKEMTDEGEEALSKIVFDEFDNIDTVAEKVRNEISERRSEKIDKSSDDLRILMKLPRFIGTTVMNVTKWFDKRTTLPKSITASDLFFNSIVISHLGSIQLPAGYHHLSNWGTNSFFVTLGEKKIRPFYDKEGNQSLKDSIDIGLTIDERIADGFYYSRTIKLLKYYLEHPELLERPLKENK